MLEEIFKKQHELSKKYIQIEVSNGIGYGISYGYGILNGEIFGIDCQRDQYLCKDFAWRITEELTECTECLPNSNFYHAKEELIDALHFMIELYIITGIDGKKLSLYSIDYINRMGLDGYLPLLETHEPLKEIFLLIQQQHMSGITNNVSDIIKKYSYRIIEYIGRAMNCLKQKPWKQTFVFTDTKRFEMNLCLAFYEWVTVAHLLGMDAEAVYDCYFAKSKVNEARQESKY